MKPTPSDRLRLLAPVPLAREGLVVLLYTPEEAISTAWIDAWRTALPFVAFAAYSIAPDDLGSPAALSQALEASSRSLGLAPSQVIVVGRGQAAGLALERALSESPALCGALALEPPPIPLPIPSLRRAARIRIVHNADTAPDLNLRALADLLHAEQVDTRIMALSNADDPDSGQALRAVEGYLTELAACAAWAGDWGDSR